MIDEIKLKELHIRDPIPIRLGNLASSVKRLGYLVYSKKSGKTIYQLFRECWLFSVWTAPDVDFEVKIQLKALQDELENWQQDFHNTNVNEIWRAEINAACEQWAARILELSGLLKTGRSGVAQN
jgi:hypothetical protein